MNRRESLLALLNQAEEPLSGSFLAAHFGVTRQVIVRDVALLPEEGLEERLAGAAVRPDSPLDYVAQYRAAHKPPPRTVYLVFLCDPGVPEGTDIVLACPHRPKQAQALREQAEKN